MDDHQWVDSSIIGVSQIVGDPGVQNDFYLSAGYDWLSKDHIYLEAVQKVSTLSDLTELLANPELDPFCIFMTLSVTLDKEDTSSWALQIDEDLFSVLPRYFHTLGPEDIEAERGDFSLMAGHVL